MDRSHANWNENTTKTFLDLCIAEKEKLNYNNKGLTKIGWQNLYRNFKSETGRAYDIKQLQNKFNALKRMFNLWKKLRVRLVPHFTQKILGFSSLFCKMELNTM
jgi:hypothetical protein